MARFASIASIRLVLLASLAFFTATVQAQVTNVSDVEATPIPGAGHDYLHMLNETVNPANGSLSVRIQVPVPKGRGLTLPFAFSYDSNAAIPGAIQSGTLPYLFKAGWSYSAPMLTAQSVEQKGTSAGDPIYCNLDTGLVFYDAQGTRHALTSGNGIVILLAGGDCQDFGYSTSLTGGDAWVSAQVGQALTVQDADGTTYTFPGGTAGVALASLVTSVEDRNGNVISYLDHGSGAFTATDTAGRTVISSNGFGTTGNTVTVSGIPNSYGLNWGTTATWNYGSGADLMYQTPNSSCSPSINYQPNGSSAVLSSLTLPNGRSYTFSYDPTYGLLNKIVYPTGAWVQYTWGFNSQSEAFIGAAVLTAGYGAHCFYRFGTPVIVKRQVSYNGTTVAEEQDFTYSTTWHDNGEDESATTWTAKSTGVTTYDLVRSASRGLSFQTSYSYSPVNIAPPPDAPSAVGTQVPVESQIVYSSWDGTVLQTVNKTWVNQYLMASEQTILPSPNPASLVTYNYGNLGIVTNKSEYDYGQTTTPTRQTISNYQSFPVNPLGSYIYDRPCQVIVEDGSSNRYAETDYFYDNGSTSTVCGTAGAPSVTGVSNLTEHDETNYGPSSTASRGNVTQKTQWGSTGTSPVTTYTYDETGKALTVTDPCGNSTCSDISGTTHTTTYSFADSYSSGTPPGATNAYVTAITDALGHKSTFAYGYADGQLTSSTDPNSQITNYKYNTPPSGCSLSDGLDRLSEIDYPDNGKTTYCYNDSPYNASTPSPSVTTTKLISSGVSEASTAAFDGVGHAVQTILSTDPDGVTYTSTSYDGLGYAYTVSNPYRTTGDSTYGITTHTYDSLGRTTQVAEPDGAKVATSYSQNSTRFLTTVTDEVGNQRITYTDGLGRLTEVDEPSNVPSTPAIATVTISGSGIETLPTPGQAATGSVTVSGAERSGCYCPVAGCQPAPAVASQSCAPGSHLVYDLGTVSITVNGHTDSTSYGQNSTSASVASGLVGAINGDSSAPVTATLSNNTVNLTSKATGTYSDYSLSASSATTNTLYFSGTSFPVSTSGSTLTGGQNGSTIYDSGTVSATVNGCTASVPYSETGNNTAGAVASALAASLGGTCYSDVSASASSDVVTLTTTATGPNADGYTLSATSASSDPSQFPTPSFGANAGSFSGGSDVGLSSPWVTQYAYDILGNLLCAVQKATDTTQFTTCAAASSTWRPRSFAYDSLSRLTSASNPESGTITYQYDANSNLSSRVAPKPGQTGTAQVTTNYVYDVLNRLYQKTYVNLLTGAAQYGYDGKTPTGCTVALPSLPSSTNLVGRRSSMCGGLSSSKWSYDSMGRPIFEARNNQGSGSAVEYKVGYTYYLDGSLNTLTYPSGDIVTYTVGGAGRPRQLTDSANNYVTSATYAPHGALAGMTNGSGIVTSNSYNDRLQPVLLSAGVAGQNPVFSLCYDFHLGVGVNSGPCSFNAYETGDNGNVFRVLNNVDSTRSATYAYDTLNRIAQANTINTTSQNCWSEVYTIDAWANLYNRAGAPGMGSCYTEGLSAGATVQNQLSGIGIMYDAAGNVINDGLGNTPTYDGENRMVTDAGVTYSYDADSRRIEKSSGTMYWPGPGGEYLTETDLTGNINEEYIFFNGARIARVDRPSGAVHYYFSDHLGSASVISDASGNVDESYYYYPYGGVQSTAGAGDPNHYKFTGKERDSESGLDMFGARYYGSSLGRFMTPDWAEKPTAVPYAMFGNPQSLNLYSYVNNNPTTTRDPDGHCLEDACVIEGGIVVTAMAVAYLSSPPGQQMLHNAASSITSLGSSISSFFHPNNSGQVAPPPPTTPTNVSQGTPGTTATNVTTGTPASTSQQGAVDNSPIESRSFSPGVKAGADANAGGKCEYCGTQTVPSQQSQAGVTTPANARQTDHYIPSSQGGSNTADNAVNSCATCNNAKSNTQPQGTKYELPRMKKPDGQ